MTGPPAHTPKHLHSSKPTWNLKRSPLKRTVVYEGPFSGSMFVWQGVDLFQRSSTERSKTSTWKAELPKKKNRPLYPRVAQNPLKNFKPLAFQVESRASCPNAAFVDLLLQQRLQGSKSQGIPVRTFCSRPRMLRPRLRQGFRLLYQGPDDHINIRISDCSEAQYNRDTRNHVW